MRLTALASVLALSACASGFEAHDGTLHPIRVSVTVAPLSEVREFCNELTNNTDAMGCATVRNPGAGYAKDAIVGGKVVVPAGYDCAIIVSPSQTLFLHEWARCFGSHTLGRGVVVKHKDENR